MYCKNKWKDSQWNFKYSKFYVRKSYQLEKNILFPPFPIAEGSKCSHTFQARAELACTNKASLSGLASQSMHLLLQSTAERLNKN